ncbi:MAG TPA: hypothetical protein VFI43_08820 [Nitrosospira sp.]|nr:hypothetical protein [Nitrosospira sp.]
MLIWISSGKSSNDRSPSQSKEEDLENWKRVRTAIEHENNLVNQRLSWLFTSQALLFSAFALILTTFLKEEAAQFSPAHPATEYVSLAPYVSIILVVLAVTGGYIYMAVGVSLLAAHRQLCALTDWWDDHCTDKSGHPELHNFLAKESPSFVSAENVPFVFFGAWLLLLSFSVLAVLHFVYDRNLIELNSSTVASAFLIFLIIGIITWAIKEGLSMNYQRHYSVKRRK